MKRSAFAVTFLFLSFFSTTASSAKDRPEGQGATPVIWENPGNIRSRNLRYGAGSAALAPVAPFTFIKEVHRGRSPKFDVKDARQVVWRVKLGPEAQPETVVTRLAWSVGYFAEETYYFEQVRTENLPSLSRGQKYVEGQGVVRGARFKPRRKDVLRGKHWSWSENPFVGTRELDGLKVLMALLNNYDADASNNRVLITRKRRSKQLQARYVVTDLGATLGRVGGLGEKRSENKVQDFLSAKFVIGLKEGKVKFNYDTRPGGLGALTILYPPYYAREVEKKKAIQSIPIAHARWIGSLLSRLTDKQLRDAFRAAGYDEVMTKAYVKAIRGRIIELTNLPVSYEPLVKLGDTLKSQAKRNPRGRP